SWIGVPSSPHSRPASSRRRTVGFVSRIRSSQPRPTAACRPTGAHMRIGASPPSLLPRRSVLAIWLSRRLRQMKASPSHSSAPRHAADAGAPAAAAELLEHALRVTDPGDEAARAERAIAAADAHLSAGDWERARVLLRGVVWAGDARSRAEAIVRLAVWVLED